MPGFSGDSFIEMTGNASLAPNTPRGLGVSAALRLVIVEILLTAEPPRRRGYAETEFESAHNEVPVCSSTGLCYSLALSGST